MGHTTAIPHRPRPRSGNLSLPEVYRGDGPKNVCPILACRCCVGRPAFDAGTSIVRPRRHTYMRAEAVTSGATGHVTGYRFIFSCDNCGTERVYGCE